MGTHPLLAGRQATSGCHRDKREEGGTKKLQDPVSRALTLSQRWDLVPSARDRQTEKSSFMLKKRSSSSSPFTPPDFSDPERASEREGRKESG